MYNFNASINSQAVLKERIVWVIFLGITFFLLYGSANQYASITGPHPSIFFEWETKIPFLEWFIIPYMSSDLLFCIALLLPQSRYSLRLLSLRIFFLVLVSCFLFILFPLQYSFQKPEIETFTGLFKLLEADLSFNQAPSLHISLAIILWYSMKENIKSKIIKTALIGWIGLIFISTLTVYQHHFIDIPFGILMAYIIIYYIADEKDSSLINRFVTPRALKMSIYYLIASILFMVLSFKYSSLFMYGFLCFFTVSAVYAFNFKELLSYDKYPYSLQLFWFLPYYLISFATWAVYKNRLTLCSKVNDNLYIGRQPSTDEYSILKGKGITKIISLANDQVFHSKKNEYKKYNLLDMTIQDPSEIKDIIKEINELINKDEKVFIHCTLGMSRSIMVLFSYLKENNLDYSNENIKKIRKESLFSKYIEVYKTL